MAIRKVNFNLPEELIAELDAEASLQHINRTQYVIKACEQVLQKDQYLRNQPAVQMKLQELLDLFPTASRIIQ